MLNLSSSFSPHYNLPTLQLSNTKPIIFTKLNSNFERNVRFKLSVFSNCSESAVTSSSEAQTVKIQPPIVAPPVLRKRTRYRKLYPGENTGIVEEMRFVAMKLRNDYKVKRRRRRKTGVSSNSESESDSVDDEIDNGNNVVDDNEESISDDNSVNKGKWQPSLEGFMKFLVDSKLVFNFVERVIDESSDVSYAYFRKTGLERSGALSKDLEWFSQKDIVVPEPSDPGLAYVKYLEGLAETSPALFLSHFYNIYFSHITGGQVIAKQVSEKLLEAKELEFYIWDGESEELLRAVREKLNMLGEHWSRDEKNKCLREAAKSFRYLGQIVRLIIL